MTNFVEVIKQCESASGNGSKAIIRSAIITMDDDAKRLVIEAMNPFRVFGIKKVTMPKKYSSVDASINIFFELLDKLDSRVVTGNAAKDAVTNTLALFTKDTAEYLKRVLVKSLKAKFSEDTFNEVFGEELVPTFPIMLADKYKTNEELAAKVAWPCYAEWKLDGQRTVAYVTQSEVVYYARGGRQSMQYEGVFNSELLRLRNLIGCDIAVDGEIMASNFTETMNAKKVSNRAAQEALLFHVFLIMPLEQWNEQYYPHTLMQMAGERDVLLQQLQSEKLVTIPGRIVNSYEDAYAYFLEVCEYAEGLILKKMNGIYEWGSETDRSKNWIKWKPFFDVDLEIVDWYYGKEDSKFANTCGGLVMHGFDESGNRIETNVGSGLKKWMRDDIRDNFENYRGKIAEIRYQEMSLAEGNTAYALRFGTFKKMRPDKSTN